MKVYIIDPQSMRTLARLTAQSWDLCPDAWDTESSSISVTGAVPQQAKKLLLAQGHFYFIDAVTPEKGSSAKLSLKLPDSLFDRELIYAPEPDARIGWLQARLDTRFGPVSAFWSYEEGGIRYDLETPVPALIRLGGEERRVAPGRYTFWTEDGRQDR